MTAVDVSRRTLLAGLGSLAPTLADIAAFVAVSGRQAALAAAAGAMA
jgi:uncharacterized membrane protein (GlpM family)